MPGAEPPCDEAEFLSITEGMVADEAPRLFAIVQAYGEHVDGRIAGWGIAFDDHAEVMGGGAQGWLYRPEDALRFFKRGSRIDAHLVWFNPDAATPSEDDAIGDRAFGPA